MKEMTSEKERKQESCKTKKKKKFKDEKSQMKNQLGFVILFREC